MVMHQPIGKFNSPNHHHVVLLNWARAKQMDIGREGFAGAALFVTAQPSCGFKIENRGPGDQYPQRGYFGTHFFPFNPANRQERREQFARALLVWGGEYLLGSYPGKVFLAEIPFEQAPPFGSELLAHCSASTEKVWRGMMRRHKPDPQSIRLQNYLKGFEP